MSRFNLIDEKWIPVRFPDGRRDELGIRDTLLRSKDFAVIENPSPLVVAALHRFLLAILYRALEGPTDIDEARKLFREGLPHEKVTGYLETWRDRFWLFDEKYPFGQIPTFAPKTWRAWTALAVEHNADNAKVLFDHVDVTEPGSVSHAAAIRWLLATQTFAVSSGKSEISHTGTAPSAGSVFAIPVGSNLFDTMCFCLVPQNRLVMQADIPLWEKAPESIEYLTATTKVSDRKSGKVKDRAIEKNATGIVELYTWRSRSILFKDSLSDRVSEVGLASGIGYKPLMELDPMLGYVIVEILDGETKEKVKKRVAIRFEEKGFWRDFDSLLPDDAHLAPRVIEHAVLLSKTDRKRFPRGVMVLGQRYFPPRPNIAYWRQEHFALPEAISEDRDMRHDIREILIDAEKTGDKLNSACEVFANELLRHGNRKVERKDIRAFVEQLSAPAEYWSTLESRFHDILRNYAREGDSEEIRCQWLKFVRDALKKAWDQHCASGSMGDAWAIRALVKSERSVLRKLKELNQEILKLQPQEENA
jgi:CRISPR system Cascade subunit CasA